MPKKIIICCDGTGNEIKENESNVLKFYRVIKKDNTQVAYYDPGVGTISDSDAWSTFKHKAKGVFGLITGYGLDDNVLDAYRFLLRHYKQGDQVYLFGFSRGAYTIRVLAGFLNLIGLLRPHQEHLCGYALTAYKKASAKDDFRIAWRVQEVLDTTRVTIKFMGCWDTVGSVIVPRPDRFYIPSLQTLPYTEENPSVKVFRHALAIDERRRMYRAKPWKDGQLFKTNPFVKDDKAEKQDVVQMWFAGVHSDVGGGYAEAESGLAKIPLSWMVDEAKKHGIAFRETLVKRLVRGQNPKNATRIYSAPDPDGKLHNSMNWAWWILEFFPRRFKWHDNLAKRKKFGCYIPFGERRYISPDHEIHKSVRARMASKTLPKKYAPPNLPS